jgi:hypothetical protein
LAPRFAEAQAGQRAVFCMEAAPGVLAPFWGVVWCGQRRFVNAPSGRQRLHVLAAITALTHAVFTVEHLTSMTAEPVCA